MDDGKYVVFKRTELDGWMDRHRHPVSLWDLVVKDATVIRSQDVFAPPALDSYANAITVAIEVLKIEEGSALPVGDLQKIADYFHARAAEAWLTDRKIPD